MNGPSFGNIGIDLIGTTACNRYLDLEVILAPIAGLITIRGR